MTLDLVPRSSRAIAEQLNKYYRVLRGVDPDSVTIRLPTGGAFEVRHSVTNAPILSVTDAGADLAIGTSDLQPLSVTTPKLADGAVTTTKLDDLSVTTAKIIDQQVTSAKIEDGTIVEGDLHDLAVTTPKLADGSVTTIKLAGGLTGQLVSVAIATQSTNSPVNGAMPASGITLTAGTRPILIGVTLLSFTATAACSAVIEMWEGAVGIAPVLTDLMAAAQVTTKTTTWIITPPPGAHSYYLVWRTSAGTISFTAGQFWAMVI